MQRYKVCKTLCIPVRNLVCRQCNEHLGYMTRENFSCSGSVTFQVLPLYRFNSLQLIAVGYDAGSQTVQILGPSTGHDRIEGCEIRVSGVKL